ncbi:hypothetical protein MRB53_038489 [Persea americana]|nr:hypothetical protein MRB53_038489 [Persea americana]
MRTRLGDAFREASWQEQIPTYAAVPFRCKEWAVKQGWPIELEQFDYLENYQLRKVGLDAVSTEDYAQETCVQESDSPENNTTSPA